MKKIILRERKRKAIQGHSSMPGGTGGQGSMSEEPKAKARRGGHKEQSTCVK